MIDLFVNIIVTLSLFFGIAINTDCQLTTPRFMGKDLHFPSTVEGAVKVIIWITNHRVFIPKS